MGVPCPSRDTVRLPPRKGHGHGHPLGNWCRLLTTIRPAVADPWTVVVLSDRGLYSRDVFRHIAAQRWYPFMRINATGFCRRSDHAAWEALAVVTQRGRTPWAMTVACFKGRPLPCTLIGAWDARYSDPWLVVTTLAPEQASVTWYGMWSWIEQGFKDLKRGGWHWEQIKMTDPQRIARRWLLMSIASIWVVSLGGEADASLPASSITTEEHATFSHPPRRLSCFRRGVITILARLIRQQPVPMGYFYPEPWSDVLNTYP